MLAQLRDETLARSAGRASLTPGRPARPRLVSPRELPHRKLGSAHGHPALIHALCHIEFTAINLALDAVVRFDAMPAAYYQDWFGIACEEAEHFSLLAAHLQSLGYAYGDFVAHNGLWEMAEKSAADVLRRMALIPRVMEARGLDVTPAMIKRLQDIDDHDGAAILKRILADEITHVGIGTKWFMAECKNRGLDPIAAFTQTVRSELGALRGGKLNHGARARAGFSQSELDILEALRVRA